ncbi:MAG: leucine-rich repeat domain-containing protein, partial [Alistipes sp.]|nr:leucine-rich repeat domain-containing protein [Alistipes sp.]
RSLPAEIGNLKELEYLYIANSEIETIPEQIAELESCTDLEIYNCPNLKKFPMAVAQMPSLVALNISNNAQWSASEIYTGLDALATGPSKEMLQILYARQNSLEVMPESFRNLKRLTMLDLAYNKLRQVPALGKDIDFAQLYLDNNCLESLPHDEEGYFCGYASTETFSVKYNRLKKVPNIFSAKSIDKIKSVDFTGNDIDGFEGEEDGTYRGINVETFTLAVNPNLKKYPKALADSNSPVSYIILRACGIESIPKGSFVYKNSPALASLDLSYNKLKDLPYEMNADNLPYLYGLDVSFNSFSEFPYEPLDCSGLTVYAIRSQRNEKGERCLREWPNGLFNHRGLRGFYIGSNDLRRIDDTISTLIYYLDISDNPNIIFDASDICYAWMQGAYMLVYDKSQNILNCDYMLE